MILVKNSLDILMSKGFSTSWIRMRLPYDNIARSTILKNYITRKYPSFDINLVDVGCGSGNFIVWSINQSLFFKECLLIDNNQYLLDDIKSNIKANIKKTLTIKTKRNNKYHLITGKDKVLSELKIKRMDIKKINNFPDGFNIISLSAIVDLMSKSILNKILSMVDENNTLFCSLCFDGTVKWKPSHTHDKYILKFFNDNQMTQKSMGVALGFTAIDYLKNRAKKLNMKIKMCKSPWLIDNKSLVNRKFILRYLLDVKKSLFCMEGIDKDILRKWYIDKKKCIDKKEISLLVGHQDILLYK